MSTDLVAVPVALAAALSFGGAGYLQHHAAQTAPRRGPLRPRLLLDLFADSRFRWSIILSVGAFILQVVALSLAPLALVQPLLVTQLLFYLGLVTVRRHHRPDTGLLIGAVLCTVGLVCFLFVSRPSPPPPGAHFSGAGALILGLGLVVLVVVVLLVASRLRSEWRAVPLAVACAVFYGVTAGLVRSLLTFADTGYLWQRWEAYAVVVIAPLGFLFNQNAFQNGVFGSVAVATITVGDPAVSIAVGSVWLGESLAAGFWWTFGQVTSLMLMAGGVLLVARRAQLVVDRSQKS